MPSVHCVAFTFFFHSRCVSASGDQSGVAPPPTARHPLHGVAMPPLKTGRQSGGLAGWRWGCGGAGGVAKCRWNVGGRGGGGARRSATPPRARATLLTGGARPPDWAPGTPPAHPRGLLSTRWPMQRGGRAGMPRTVHPPSGLAAHPRASAGAQRPGATRCVFLCPRPVIGRRPGPRAARCGRSRPPARAQGGALSPVPSAEGWRVPGTPRPGGRARRRRLEMRRHSPLSAACRRPRSTSLPSHPPHPTQSRQPLPVFPPSSFTTMSAYVNASLSLLGLCAVS